MKGYASNKEDGRPPEPDALPEGAPLERTASATIRTIPFALWARFNQRREAEQGRLGQPITREDVLLDLIQQYADGVTWYGRKDRQAP